MKRVIVLFALAGLMSVANTAFAQTHTATTTLNVSTDVQAVCSVATAPVDFGVLYPDLSGAWTNGIGTITVNCTNGLNYAVYLSSNTGQMKDAGSTRYADYGLYKDAARTQDWGPPLSLGGLESVGSGSDQAHTVYGRAKVSSMSGPGAVSDTVTVTVQF